MEMQQVEHASGAGSLVDGLPDNEPNPLNIDVQPPQIDEECNCITKELEDLVRVDNDIGFVNYVQNYVERVKSGISEISFGPRELLMCICSHCAVKCGTALLEGKTGLASVNLNMPFPNGFYALHQAAENSCPGLAELFLMHGANTGLRHDENGSTYHGMLPLNVALEVICRNQFLRQWSPEVSVFKLVYYFCLPEMIQPLKTLQVLALNTEGIEGIASSYALDVRFAELVALLLVAREQLIPSIAKCIMDEIRSVIDAEMRLWGGDTQNSNLICTLKQRKSLMLSAALLLEIFARAGNAIEKYQISATLSIKTRYQIAFNVAKLLEDHGFHLKERDIDLDDINCSKIDLDNKHKEKLSRSLRRVISQKHGFSTHAQKSKVSILNGRERIVSGLPQPRPSGFYSTLRSFHSCQVSEPGGFSSQFMHVVTQVLLRPPASGCYSQLQSFHPYQCSEPVGISGSSMCIVAQANRLASRIETSLLKFLSANWIFFPVKRRLLCV